MVQQERARITRRKIMLGAADVIRRVGYANATLGDISEAAGVTKGALYFHFESKEDIARALIDEQHRITRGAAEAILTQDAPAVETMMRLCFDLAQRLTSDQIIRAGIRLTTDSSTFEAPIQDPYRDWMATFEQLAARAAESGETTGAIPPDVFARFIIPAFTGVQLVSETFDGRTHLPERVREMWEILLHALADPTRLESHRTTLDRIVDEFSEQKRSHSLHESHSP